MSRWRWKISIHFFSVAKNGYQRHGLRRRKTAVSRRRRWKAPWNDKRPQLRSVNRVSSNGARAADRRIMEVRPVPRPRESTTMSHRSLRRQLTAAVLAAVLAGAAPAHARDLGTAGRAWTWLQDAWTRGVSALWDRTPAPARNSAAWQKEGLGLDPNGSTSPAPAPAAPDCTTCSDQGYGVDPNG
jgi:hypothetical protein